MKNLLGFRKFISPLSLFIMLVFLSIWHVLFVLSAYSNLAVGIETNLKIKAPEIESLLSKNDIVSLEKNFWSMMNESIRSIEFIPGVSKDIVTSRIILGAPRAELLGYFREYLVVNNGLHVGKVLYQISVPKLSYEVLKSNIISYGLVSLFVLSMLFLNNYSTIRSLENIEYKLVSISESGLSEAIVSDILKNIDNGKSFHSKGLSGALSNIFANVLRLLKIETELEKARSMSTLSKQVAHDIRSPLSALNMVMGTLKDLPEEKRILIRGATQRINDIANDQLRKGKEGAADPVQLPTVGVKTSPALSLEFIPALVDILVSEKRMQFRDQEGLAIEADLKDSFGSFTNINANELKRVISNLVNNAVEAFESKRGLVTVVVRKLVDTKMIEILVKDNGRGIPEHVLARLGQQGVSHGKEGTSSGSGIGVYHAMRTMESFGGKLLVESIVGIGTAMRLILPMAEPPKWFASLVDLTGKTKLVSLDDDISIHQIWSGRLQSLGLSTIEHIKIQSGDVFEKYVYENMSQLKNILFLVDFELINQQKTGLDLIEELGLEKYSVLVTSRYEESGIQERAGRIGLKLLPKSLAGFVPINIEAPKEKYDWVLIDDDELTHMSWKMASSENNKRFIGFKTPEEFKAFKKNLDPNSQIYIDSNLGNGIKGEDVAKQLFIDGFKNLYLATGYDAEQFLQMDFVKAVVGKEPPC